MQESQIKNDVLFLWNYVGQMLSRIEAEEERRKKIFSRPSPFIRTAEESKRVNEKSVNISQKKEINAMMLNLGIKGSVRARSDGLLELRFWIDGSRKSVYGKTEDELIVKFKLFLKKEKEKQKAPNLLDWLQTWRSTYKKGLAENSLKAIDYCIGKQIKQCFRNKPINKYSPLELEEGMLKIDSTRMRKYTHGILTDSFQRAFENGLIKKNPAANLTKVKHTPTKSTALSRAEQCAFLQKIQGTLHENFFRFLLYSGCRRNEATSLKWTDIDFEGKKILIRGTKTKGSFRYIPLFKNIESMFLQMPREGEKVFSISDHQASLTFKTFMPNHHLHELRHTFATNCLEAGVDMKVLQQWLGHSNIQTTLNIYSHVMTEFEREQADIIDNTPFLPHNDDLQ